MLKDTEIGQDWCVVSISTMRRHEVIEHAVQALLRNRKDLDLAVLRNDLVDDLEKAMGVK